MADQPLDYAMLNALPAFLLLMSDHEFYGIALMIIIGCLLLGIGLRALKKRWQ